MSVQSCVDGGRDVEAHHEGAVLAGLENLQQKLGGRLLLKLKAGANGGAGVNDDADAQRQIDLLVKGIDSRRRLLVVEQGKVAQLEIGDVMAVLVSHREDEVDLVDAQADGGRRSGRTGRERPGAGCWALGACAG